MPYSASCSAFSHGLEMEKSKEKQVLTMSARYASAFHEASVRAGADAKKLNQILDMGDDPFGNPTHRIPCDNVLDMIAFAQDSTGNRSIGLMAGQDIRPSSFLDVGYALISANSLRHALGVNEKYQALTQQVATTHLDVDEDGAHVTWTPYYDDDERVRPITEAAYVGYVNIGRWLLWLYNEEAISVSFRHQRPSDPDPCETHFGCKIKYGADTNRLSFKAHLADAKLPQANPELLEQLEVRLERAHAALEGNADFPELVYQAIQEYLLKGAPNRDLIARSFGMSGPTLQRRLQNEKTSFRNLLQTVRQDNANFLLKENTKSLAEISLMLGYGDQTAFTRAYKSWIGYPPSFNKA